MEPKSVWRVPLPAIVLVSFLALGVVITVSISSSSRSVFSSSRQLRINDPTSIQFKEPILIRDLQYQLDMLKARSTATVHGPINFQALTQEDISSFSQFETQFRVGDDIIDGTGGKSSMTQVPKVVVEEDLMQRVGEGWAKVWSRELIDRLVDLVVNRQDISPPDYPGCALQIRKALEDHVSKIPSPHIMVGGSISPWVEATVLGSLPNVKKVVVADWQEPEVQDPRIETMSAPNLSTIRPNQLFDVIITYSSIEHDGLGRYGDPINPNGDLASLAEYYTLLKDGGLLLLGVPFNEKEHSTISNNHHRIYGQTRINALTAGFELLEMVKQENPELLQRYNVNLGDNSLWPDWKRQPVYVLRKKKEELPLLLQ